MLRNFRRQEAIGGPKTPTALYSLLAKLRFSMTIWALQHVATDDGKDQITETLTCVVQPDEHSVSLDACQCLFRFRTTPASIRLRGGLQRLDSRRRFCTAGYDTGSFRLSIPRRSSHGAPFRGEILRAG